MDTAGAVSTGAITPAHGAALDDTPLLVWLAFAVASGTGLLGSALLFKASGHAKQVFALSAICAAGYYVWVYMISGTGADRPAEELYIAAVVIGVTLGFCILSRRVALSLIHI